ncbi:MAG: hypothetical protein ACLPOA_05400 [Methylocella sp.]
MDDKQSVTSAGQRARLLHPNWNNFSTIERLQKALFKKRLPSALDTRAGVFPAQLTQIAHPQNFAYRVRIRAVRGDNSRSLVPVRAGLSKFALSCRRYRSSLMLSRPSRQTTILGGAFPKLSVRFGEIFAALTRRVEA